MSLKFIYGLSIVLLLTLELTCSNPTSPPPPLQEMPKAVKLKLIDVSCNEAYINVTASDTVLPINITLNKDEKALFNFTLTKTDTAVLDTTLQASKTYIYQTTEIIKGNEENSDTLQVKTLDTTNHNFNWRTFTFGDFASSVLYDVAIINDTTIYAVGEIYLNDSTGQPDPLSYNLTIWNGYGWTIKRVPYHYQGQTTFDPIYSIFVFDINDIWFGTNIHWNGKTYEQPNVSALVGWYANKMWGLNSNDLFAVGYNGNIAHYQNGQWNKVESGTNLNINDIWGIDNNGLTKILAIASNIYQIDDKKILSITSNDITEQSNNGLPWSMASVWFNNIYKSYVGGDGLFVKYVQSNEWMKIELPPYYIFSIRGNGLNDIIVCGGLGYVGHFNGSTWINYLGNGLEQIVGNYYSASIKGNIVSAAGATADGKAIVIIGFR